MTYKVGDIVEILPGTNRYTYGNEFKLEGPISCPVSFTDTIVGIIEGYCRPKEWAYSWFKLSDVKKVNMEEKKIKGYKFKKECESFEAAAIAIIKPHTSYPDATKFSDFLDVNSYECIFRDGSLSGRKLQEAGVLDLWFEPVYEPEKPKETILKLGDKKIEVKIGKGYIKADGKTVTREEVLSLQKLFYPDRNTNAPWAISFPSMKIGCTVVTYEEVVNVIGEYIKLNS